MRKKKYDFWIKEYSITPNLAEAVWESIRKCQNDIQHCFSHSRNSKLLNFPDISDNKISKK